MKKIGLVVVVALLCLGAKPWRQGGESYIVRNRQEAQRHQELVGAIQNVGQGPAMQQYVAQLERRIVQLEAAVNRHDLMLREAGRQLAQMGHILEQQNQRTTLLEQQ